MGSFQISPFLKIKGIGSASGLVYHENQLFIISDNSTYLYQYTISEGKLNKIPLVKNPQENILKKDKPDFESITLKGNKLHLFGSASTNKRTKTLSYHLHSGKINVKDLTDLYDKIKEKLSIADDELNIEGVVNYKEKLFLFQRGNGATAKNGIIKIDDKLNIEFVPFALPKLKTVESSFTDAILVDNKIYFLATAENSTSTYDDGDVLGSSIGSIDMQTMAIEFTLKISDSQKFEGLTLYNKTPGQIEFLLCEDKDSEVLESIIYSLKLGLKNN